jgi:chaperonin GroEL (HSP60 family)
MNEENRILKAMVAKLVAAGANVLLCQKGIDDIAQHHLAKTHVIFSQKSILYNGRRKTASANTTYQAVGGGGQMTPELRVC